jgi:hypothetical protein
VTPWIKADELAQDFNTCADRGYWVARVGGTHSAPTVKFASRSNMCELVLDFKANRFEITYKKTSCAWGDFTASMRKAVSQVLQAMKATGYPVEAPLDDIDGLLRIEFDPKSKRTYVTIADMADDWCNALPGTCFKAPEQIPVDNAQ